MTSRRMCGRGPIRVLQDNTVTIGILECLASYIPVWIVRLHGCVTMSQHSLDCCLPLHFILQVEHQQIFLRGRFAGRMTLLAGEFKMVRRTAMSDHYAVEALMILK